PLERGVLNLAAGRRLVPEAALLRLDRRQPARQVRTDALGKRVADERIARAAQTPRERIVHLDDLAGEVRDGNEMPDRVVRVLELPARTQHVLEQLRGFDGIRELAAQFVRAVEQ